MRQVLRFMSFMVVAALLACASRGGPPSGGTATSERAPLTGVPGGYQRRMVNGQEMFCRHDEVTGSRAMGEDTCLTRQQLEEEQKNSSNNHESQENPAPR